MKKLFLLVNLFLAIILIGCSFQQTTINTTNESTTITTSDTETTTKIETSDTRIDVLQDELDLLEALIPSEISNNFTLPNLTNTTIQLTYLQDGVVLEGNNYLYIPNDSGIYSTLGVKLEYDGIVWNLEYVIYNIENETVYHQYIVEKTFNEVEDLLNNSFPSEIEYDLELVKPKIDGVSITYDIDQNVEVYNNFVVFEFLTVDKYFNIEATINFEGESKTLDFPIKMKRLDTLSKIPEIRITTDLNQEVLSKEEYVNGNFSLVGFDESLNELPLITNQQVSIRCRGNSTYYMPKLSYRLKFEEKTSLLFDYYEDDWVLLANFTDQTLIRNSLANSLSSAMNMEFTPSHAFVDLYLNNEYLGNYMLTDQIQVTNDRVDIEEHSLALNTGYLIEMDKRMLDPMLVEGVEGHDWFMLYGVPYVIKSPKTDWEYYSVDQLYFIEDYLLSVHLALQNNLDYSHLIDESTFIDWFIINEVFQNVDSGYSSVYMYKDRDGLLKMGPIWDFDLSTGNPGHLGDDLRQPEGWYTCLEFKNIWYYYLFQYEDFRSNLKTRWNEIYDDKIQALLDDIYPTANSISKSRYTNFQKWDVIGKWSDWYTAPEIYAADTYQKQLEFLYNFLETRMIWMNEEINKW